MENHHRPSEEEAQDAGGQREPKGGAVVRREDGGAQAEVAERHAGNRGEGEDTEEREGTGGEQSQASVEWGGHGEQRIGDDPEAECHPQCCCGIVTGQVILVVQPARTARCELLCQV